MCTVFDSVSSNIDEVISINPPAVFVFGDFNAPHKDWFTYSGGTDRLGELYYNLSFLSDLTQMVIFPTRIPDCDCHSAAHLDFFLLMLQWLSLLGNSDHVVVSVYIDFPTNSQWDASFHCIAYDYSCADLEYIYL